MFAYKLHCRVVALAYLVRGTTFVAASALKIVVVGTSPTLNQSVASANIHLLMRMGALLVALTTKKLVKFAKVILYLDQRPRHER